MSLSTQQGCFWFNNPVFHLRSLATQFASARFSNAVSLCAVQQRSCPLRGLVKQLTSAVLQFWFLRKQSFEHLYRFLRFQTFNYRNKLMLLSGIQSIEQTGFKQEITHILEQVLPRQTSGYHHHLVQLKTGRPTSNNQNFGQ